MFSNCAPLGHVPKREEPPPRLGRLTTNASAGDGGGYHGTLNECTDQLTLTACYRLAAVTTTTMVTRFMFTGVSRRCLVAELRLVVPAVEE